MKRVLMRNLSLNPPNFFSHQTLKLNPNLPSFSSPSPSPSPSPSSSLASSLSQIRFFSSPETDLNLTQNKDTPIDDVEDVSNQEFKMLLDKYGDGHGDALPMIFEAILKRKLARKHEESDDEFMEELRNKPVDSSVKNEEHESDSEGFDETDEELED